MRIYAQPSLLKYAEYANSIAPKILDSYEKWTGIAYPLSKLGKDLFNVKDINVLYVQYSISNISQI